MAKTLSIGECLSVGWNATKSNLGLVIGVQIVSILLVMIPAVVAQFVASKSALLGNLLLFVLYLVQFLIYLGMVKIGIKLASNEPASFEDLFSQSGRLLTYVVATILCGLAVFVGFILLIVPGIIAMVGLCFYPYEVVNGAGAVDSLKRSWAVTKGAKWTVFALMFVCSFVTAVGILALGVGILITAPIAFLALTHAYLTLAKQTTSA